VSLSADGRSWHSSRIRTELDALIRSLDSVENHVLAGTEGASFRSGRLMSARSDSSREIAEAHRWPEAPSIALRRRS
jgi:hypothetical protein